MPLHKFLIHTNFIRYYSPKLPVGKTVEVASESSTTEESTITILMLTVNKNLEKYDLLELQCSTGLS